MSHQERQDRSLGHAQRRGAQKDPQKNSFTEETVSHLRNLFEAASSYQTNNGFLSREVLWGAARPGRGLSTARLCEMMSPANSWSRLRLTQPVVFR